ncbi:MAG: hypothetical protein JSV34_05200 [Candidatus Omnitrophota bacterium]|nr:MAG: hypothetical protein JSV34_05200 [Candidatus Omnitrophota bacterium]
MSRGKVGLYLGVASAGAVVVDNRKVVSLAKFDLSSFEEETQDTLNEEIRWEALINRTLREAGAQAKDIYVSITDRDFIFRSFEIPLMKRREITSSLIYEIEKYIPFKMGELRWDYRFVRFPKEKKIDISFVGIRNDNFQKIKDILKRLNLNSIYTEPSSLSIIRIIKSLPRLSHLKNFALLDFTKSEVYLTFFYYNLPIFNRYLVIPKEGDNINLDKLIEAVRLSFLYFKREYKFFEPEKMLVISNSQNENLVASLKGDLQIETENVPLKTFIRRENAEIEHLKALGVAERDNYPLSFAPYLLTTQEQLAGKGEKIAPLRIGLISFLGILGVLMSVFLSSFMENRLSAERELVKKESKLVLPEGIASWLKIEQEIASKSKRVSSLKNLAAPLNKISPFLEKLPYFLPQGLWLEGLELAPYRDKYRVILRGNIFLSDAYQERLEIDKFISDLKNKEEIKSLFSNIEMTSSERRRAREFMITFFAIKLE